MMVRVRVRGRGRVRVRVRVRVTVRVKVRARVLNVSGVSVPACCRAARSRPAAAGRA